MALVKTAGIREARRNLLALIDDVKRGRDIVITDRGRPVARLVPPTQASARGVPDLSAFRRRMPALTPPLSAFIAAGREQRF